MVPNQLLAVAGFGITAPGGAGGKLNTATVAFVSDPIVATGRTTQLLAGEFSKHGAWDIYGCLLLARPCVIFSCHNQSPLLLLCCAGNVPTSSGLCEGDYGAPLLLWNAAFVGPNGESQGIPASRDPQNQRQVRAWHGGALPGARLAWRSGLGVCCAITYNLRSPPLCLQLAIYSNGPPCGQAFSTSFYTDLRINTIRVWINSQMAGASGWIDLDPFP